MASPVTEVRSNTRASKRGGLSAAKSWPVAVAILLGLFYLGSSIYIATQRLFWFDELFTLYIATVPKLSIIFTALGNGVDALPPTYYMLIRMAVGLFGQTEVVARFASALALAVGMVITFDCARRLTNGVYGL